MEQDNRPTRQSIAVNDASTFSGTGGKESSQVVITGPESGLSENSTELYISNASRHLTENAFFKTPPSVADDTLKPWISMLTDADYYMHTLEMHPYGGDPKTITNYGDFDPRQKQRTMYFNLVPPRQRSCNLVPAGPVGVKEKEDFTVKTPPQSTAQSSLGFDLPACSFSSEKLTSTNEPMSSIGEIQKVSGIHSCAKRKRKFPSMIPRPVKEFKLNYSNSPSANLQILKPSLKYTFNEVKERKNITCFECHVMVYDEKNGIHVKLTGRGANKKAAKNDLSIEALKHFGKIHKNSKWPARPHPEPIMPVDLKAINNSDNASFLQLPNRVLVVDQEVSTVKLVSDLDCSTGADHQPAGKPPKIDFPCDDEYRNNSSFLQNPPPRAFSRPAATSRPWKSLALHKDCVNPVWLVYQLVGASNVEYKLISEDGPDHAKCFKTLVKYKDKEFVAAGRKKKTSKLNAARKLLFYLRNT